MSGKKDMRQLVRCLKKQGWKARIARNGHWRLTSPQGAGMTCSFSPSDHQAVNNARRDARKLGADV